MQRCNYGRSSDISTHSLTRRLTEAAQYFNIGKNISTHSLTRRLTNQPGLMRKEREHFNSQPHKEADSILTVLTQTQ